MSDAPADAPADQGLSSLGLLMQLGGSVFAAATAVFVLGIMLDDGAHDVGPLMLLLLVSVGRSLLHRQAGTTLLYGAGTHRLQGIRLYVLAGLAHSVFTTMVFALFLHAPLRSACAAGAGLAVWPLCLAIIFALPAFRRFDNDLPLTEDKGFEGASILMTILGLTGATATAIVLIGLLRDESMLSRGPGVLIALALSMLIVRSALHVEAGIGGLRETNMERAVSHVNRYANYGVISSFCGGGALLLFFVTQRPNVLGIATVCALCWMLVAWPLTIRRFVADRQFADLMAGGDAAVHRRAPDGGLTGLGWLLVGHAMLQATILLPQLIGGSLASASLIAGLGARSLWLSVGVVVLETWAGYELVRSSHHHRRGVATAYAIVGAATTIYVNSGALAALQHARVILTTADAAAVGALVFALIVPIATLLLVNRKMLPTARARFRA